MIVAAFLLSSSLSHSDIDQTLIQYKIAVEADGVYRVAFEDLNPAGRPLRSDRISISVQGNQIPIWIQDGGDGWFNAGDAITFIGQHLEGTSSYYSEKSRFNIYWLSSTNEGGLRMREGGFATRASSSDVPALVTKRLEQQKLRVALPHAANTQTVESWYMARLSHLDSSAFSWRVDLGSLQKDAPAASIRVGLAGLSRDHNAARSGLAQHRIELALNGVPIGNGEWDGQEGHVIDLPEVDSALLASGWNEIEISVPVRRPPGKDSPVIDVSLLNWIELSHAFNSMPDSGQQAIEVASSGATIIPLPWPGSMLFSGSGQYIILPEGTHQVRQLDEAGRWFVLKENAYLSPAWIRPDQPSGLSRRDQQADYLIITHATLAEAVAPLAEHHLRNGLSVAIVDVEDIYDEFNHGIRSPEAIRDFISHAWHHWQQPAPRFVLLAGDASWDIFDAHGDGHVNDLVPTLQVQAHDELAASDNGFVTVSGDDWHPDLAIGRIPASNPGDLSSIVGKLLRYETDPEVGPWRRRIAWVTDRDESFQNVSNALANRTNLDGYHANRIFPNAEAGVRQQDQSALRQALIDGGFLLHFLGHGGRFVWRTGPPDYRESSDLFSDADITALPPGRRLPLVLSMTCSSGPFDHPTADSIAETFLRVADRGAIGVLAASWRIPASQPFSEALIRELTAGDVTVGQAVMKAKQVETNRALVESYNFLGDPAIRLSRPQARLTLSANVASEAVTVSARPDPAQFPQGKTTIDWLDASGHRLKTEQTSVTGNHLEFRYLLRTGEAPPASASVYIWSTVSARDAIGTVEIVE